MIAICCEDYMENENKLNCYKERIYCYMPASTDIYCYMPASADIYH